MARRVAFAVFFAVVLALQPAHPALADEQWCETDPIFSIAGHPLRATTRFVADPSTVLYVTYELTVPEDVDASLLAPATLASDPLAEGDTTMSASERVSEQAIIARHAPAANGGAFSATLAVTVVTSNTADSYPVTITLYGPYILAPISYTGVANTTTTIAIPIPGA